MSVSCHCREILKENGIEATPHRKAVLEVIAFASKALPAKDVLRLMQRRQAFDKVTLYRTLELFAQKRIVKRIASSKGSVFYEIICQDHKPSHAHFICRHCGEIECLENLQNKDIASVRRKIGKRFLQQELDFKLEGLCEKCQK